MRSAAGRLSAVLRPYDLTLFYAVDPGSFATMRPVLEVLEAEGRAARWVLDGWSLSSWGPRLEHWTTDTFRAAAASMSATRCVMVLGAQMDLPATRGMIRQCTAHGVDTLFLFDHWCAYREHFLDPLNGELVLPDLICLMDAFAAREMTRVLAAYEQQTEVRIVGHPALEAQVEDVQSRSVDESRELRRVWNVELGKLQAFLLEPVEFDFPDNQIGYSEYSILEYFFAHLADPTATVVVRPHPRHDPGEVRLRLAALDTRGVTFLVSDHGSVADLVSAADEVFGMTTIALILSIMSGKPTKSIQVGRNRRGYELSNPHLEEILIL